MEITEMLDELKSRARRDDKLRAELLETRKNAQLEKNFMLLCAEVPMVVGKILRCWRVRMIFTSCFLRDWSKL